VNTLTETPEQLVTPTKFQQEFLLEKQYKIYIRKRMAEREHRRVNGETDLLPKKEWIKLQREVWMAGVVRKEYTQAGQRTIVSLQHIPNMSNFQVAPFGKNGKRFSFYTNFDDNQNAIWTLPRMVTIHRNRRVDDSVEYTFYRKPANLEEPYEVLTANRYSSEIKAKKELKRLQELYGPNQVFVQKHLLRNSGWIYLMDYNRHYQQKLDLLRITHENESCNQLNVKH
jgi:hypothetical protein